MRLWCVVPVVLLLSGCISFPKHITSNCAALPLPPVPQVQPALNWRAGDDEYGETVTADIATARSVTDTIMQLSQALRQHREWIQSCRESKAVK